MKFEMDLNESGVSEQIVKSEEIPALDILVDNKNLTMLPINGKMKSLEACTEDDLIQWTCSVLPFSNEVGESFRNDFLKRFKLQTLKGKELLFDVVVAMHEKRVIFGTGAPFYPEEIRSN